MECGQAMPTVPVPAVAIQAAVETEEPDAPQFTGRERELQVLLGAAQRLQPGPELAGAGGAIFLIGEAGVGKTRLAGELHRALLANQSDAPILWLQVTADPAQHLQAYGLVADLVRQAAERGATLAESVRALFPEDSDNILPYLEMLLSRPVPAERLERVSFLQPHELRQQMYRAVYELLVALARHNRTIVACDDLQWIDAASAELLSDLIPAITARPLLFIGALHPDTDTPGYALFQRGRELSGPRYQELRLAPLGWVESRTLLDELLPPDAPEPLRASALAQARGNALHLVTIARAYAEGSLLATPTASLYELLLTRIAHLDADRRRTLQLLSVLGVRGEGAVVQGMVAAGGQSEGLEQRLQALADLGWLTLKPGLAYAFRHPSLAQAVYQGVPPARRRQLHTLAGEAIERCHVDDESVLEMLAYHYRVAEERERALDRALRAALKAMRRFAMDTARAHFVAAENLAQQMGHAAPLAEIDVALAEIATHLGQTEEAEMRFRSALARPAVASSPSAQARVRIKLGRLYERGGRASLWFSELQLARQLLEDQGLTGSIDWAHVIIEQAWASNQRADYDTARALCAEAKHALADLEPTTSVTAHQAHAENVLGAICHTQGRYSEALEHYSRALEIDLRAGDLERAAVVHNNIGELWRQMGNPNRAIEHYHAARECYERIGRRDGIVLVDNNTGMAFMQSGDWDAARRLLMSVVERAQVQGYNWLLTETHYALGEVMLALNDLDGARGQGTLALTMSEKHGNVVDRAVAQRLLAKIALRDGDVKAGRLRLREVLRTLEGVGETREACVTALDLAQALHDGASRDEADQLLARAADLATQMGARDLLARVETIKAGAAA
jgi:tetratricopeptide (TPR) repeat protein